VSGLIRTPPIGRTAGLGLARELALRAAGRRCIAGLDEVGRGPLAGPVVAAAVVLDPDRVPDGLADSKALPAARREALFAEIVASAQVGIATVSHEGIDAINIRQASLRAMSRALAALPCTPDMALVDGNDPPPLPCAAEAVIRGDATVASIAAASIVAKVVRDQWMSELDREFPEYGFAEHKGYGAPKHRRALERLGPSPIHRRSYAPLAALRAAGAV
jgi:ribonuclease HII